MPVKENVLNEKSINDVNYEELQKLFPHAVSIDDDGKYLIDPQKLQMSLDPSKADIKEDGYGLNWVGKKEAYHQAFSKNYKVLKPLNNENSKNWDETANILIKGDNLDALKILRQNYFEAIKMIYIDPPYNLDSDGFVYNDKFSANTEEILEALGYDKEYIDYIENIQGAKTHSGWLSFMYSRLLLAKDLLKDDGVIFISIDENEVAQLKVLCDEVFGEGNRLSTHHMQVRYANKTLNEKNDWQPVMEYVFIYAKNVDTFKPKKESNQYSIDKFVYEFQELSPGDEIKVKDRKVNVFKSGEWKVVKNQMPSIELLKETWVSGSIYTSTGNGDMVQNVIEPRLEMDGYGALYKIDGLGEDGLGYRYFVGPQTKGAIRSKMFSGVPTVKVKGIEEGTEVKYKSISNLCVFEDYSPDFGNIANEGGVKFNNGKKPIKMLSRLIEICNLAKDDIVLDFFAGSGSTAHAVMKLNSEDEKHRKFIMVQLPESCVETSDAYKAGYKNIFEITKTRIKIAGDQIAKGDTGFRTFEIIEDAKQHIYQKSLEKTTQEDLISFTENLVLGSHEDILYNLLVAEGLPLSLSIETIVSDKLYLASNVAFVLGDISIDVLVENLKDKKELEFITVYSPNISDDKFTLELESAVGNIGIKPSKLRFRG